MFQSISYEFQPANSWKSWRITINYPDEKKDEVIQEEKDSYEMWDQLIGDMKKFTELSFYVNQDSSYFLFPNQMKQKFSNLELHFISSQSKDIYPRFYILPVTFLSKQIISSSLPLYARLLIETEPEYIYFLHKTNISKNETYFDQLKIDLNHAKEEKKSMLLIYL